MQKTNDSVVFESRDELCDVIRVLESWMDDHPEDEKKTNVRKLLKLLDAIEMSW